jgi:hypothetical protein
MKKLVLAVCLFIAAFALSTAPVGCSSPPSSRVAQVQTLKAVGQSAEGAVQLSARLYQGGSITADQARQVMDFYNTKFQPAFRIAVAAVNANLDSLASPDVSALASQLSALVLSFKKHMP